MFLAAAVNEDDLTAGAVYPPLSKIRQVSLAIAVAVAEQAWEEGVARAEHPADVKAMIKALMYEPGY